MAKRLIALVSLRNETTSIDSQLFNGNWQSTFMTDVPAYYFILPQKYIQLKHLATGVPSPVTSDPQGQPSWCRECVQLPPSKKTLAFFNPQDALSTLGCHPLSKKDSWKHPVLCDVFFPEEKTWTAGNRKPNVLKLRKMNFFSFENAWICLGF